MKKFLANNGPVLRKLIQKVQREPIFGFDTESSGPPLMGWRQGRLRPKPMVNVWKSTLTGFSLAFPDGTAYYIPVAHRTGHNAPGQEVHRLLTAISQTDAHVAIHNLKHEILALRHGYRGFELRVDRALDTQVMAWLLHMRSSNLKHPFGLKYLVPTYLGWEMASFEDTVKGKCFDELPPIRGMSYACDDARAALELAQYFEVWMGKYSQWRPYWEMEAPLIRILAHIEDTGLEVDPGTIQSYVDLLEPMVHKLEREWEFVAGCNINSPRQVAEVMYGEGHWDKSLAEKTKTGHSVNTDSVLPQLQACPEGSIGRVAAEIKLKHSAAKKLLSAYTTALVMESEQFPDGRFHAGHNQTGTVTGRLSVSRLHQLPNPEKLPEGLPNIRDAFVAGEGRTFVGADYSQIELRVIAHLAGRGDLYDAFNSGAADIHQACADRLGISRSDAKNGNYALVYGSGPRTLAKTTGKSVEECKEFLQRMREMRPELGQLADRIYSVVSARGYVRTLGGRMRPVPELAQYGSHSCGTYDCEACLARRRGERIAFNTPAQGGARDIVTKAMVKLYREVERRGWLGKEFRLSTQIHDELVCEVSTEVADEAAELLGKSMREAVELRVPLVAEPKVSKRLGQLK